MRMFVLLLGLLVGCGQLVFAADAPTPAAGAIPLLVLTQDGNMDAQYEAELGKAGFVVTKVRLSTRLSLDYLKQFPTIILTDIPHPGEDYTVEGWADADIPANLSLIHDYLAAGGGVLFECAASEFGEFYADGYNALLGRYGVKFFPQGLRDDAETITVSDKKNTWEYEHENNAYARGELVGNHPIVQGLKDILYPTHVFRWDLAYGTTPFTTTQDWTLLATGKPTSGTHYAISNGDVGPRQTDNRTILAIRPVGKGQLMISAIHNYYTLTEAYNPSFHIGEDDTGALKGIALNGFPNGPASELGKLLLNAYHFLADNSRKNGLGGAPVALPEQPKKPEAPRTMDWHAVNIPPSWQHRPYPVWHADVCYYDELADWKTVGEMHYFKALVGARTACSSGKGTVKEYRTAAQQAGYSAIYFTETLEDTTADKWAQFVKDCEANSDATFACVPGFDLEDAQGQRYLVFGVRRFPDPTTLTPDGKRLEKVTMLSLGWAGILTSMHRAGQGKLHPKMWKHFQGVTVYTYDGAGKLVDDALPTYQWQVLSDASPFPIAAHEVTDPAQVATAAASGFQQIMPAPTLAQAIDYFHYGLEHNFDDPSRYFISEGPLLTGWSILNKDIGFAQDERDHFRVGIGVTGTAPITEVTLSDGLDTASRWQPNTPTFATAYDGFHDMQHEFLLMAADANGRRVLSPPIRTVCTNWRLRCGDKQNWLGTLAIYTGTRSPFVTWRMPIKGSREGVSTWQWNLRSNPSHILDFPFYSNHVQVDDVDLTTKYVNAEWEQIGGDTRYTHAVQSNEFIDGYERTTCYTPRVKNFATARVEVLMHVKKAVEPEIKGALYPILFSPPPANDLLILPGQAPAKLSAQKDPLDLPIGSYVAGVVILSPGLRLVGHDIGFPAPAAGATLPAGTTFTASYVYLRGLRFAWRNLAEGGLYAHGFTGQDAIAPQALAAMGFGGQAPYKFTLKQGTLDKVAFTAEFTAKNGGIAGKCVNAQGQALPDNLPCAIHGLNPHVASAVWRADAPRLDYFACFPSTPTVQYTGNADGSWKPEMVKQDPFGVQPGTGMVSFNADKTVDFYAGNVATCDSALSVSVVIWNAREAWFRVNNPTDKDITTTFATAAAIKGFKAVKEKITVKAGTSVEVKK